MLHRWTQILSVAYALPQLLATYCGEQMQELMRLTPWWKKATVTAGQVRLGLRLFFGNVRVSGLVEPDMPEIPAGLFPANTGRYCLCFATGAGAKVKEQKGGLPATVMMAVACLRNSKLQSVCDLKKIPKWKSREWSLLRIGRALVVGGTSNIQSTV